MRQKIIDKINSLSATEKKVVYPSIGVSISFMAIHIVLLILFFSHRVMPMAYFNIFSILFYFATFIMIRKKKHMLFVVSVYLEVLVHMFLAVFFVGWGAGFQVTLIGIIIMIFFAEYSGRVMNIKYISGIPLAIITMFVYLLAYVVSELHDAPYDLPHSTEFAFQIVWGVITFVIEIFFLEVFALIASRSERRLSEQVAHDELTGLFSRHFMNEYLDRILNEPGKHRYWVAMTDIDDFKKVNDTYGHNCGDYVLRTIAQTIRNELPGCEVCRWGGEEFLIVGQIRDNLETECENLNRIRLIISEYDFEYEGQKLKATITIGLAAYGAETTQEEWINRADQSMYQGKCSGKNKVVVN